MIGIRCSNASRSHRLSAASEVLTHEGIVDRLVALENLAMHLALVVVPDLAARLGKHSLDRQQEAHWLRLEDAALRIDEREAFAFEDEARLQLGRRQMIVHLAKSSDVLKSRHAHEPVTIRIIHARCDLDRPS